MAEPDASTHTLMAGFGWLSIAQAELYTREAERKRLSIEHSHPLGTKVDEKSLTLDQPAPPMRKKEAKN